ncbi:hypothetical protein [Comamonas sediminis]|uniref:Uncharacterized protein n=1 Tax=Comamonas sediminis TaxID=1783360 RepID=A0ABV4B647_9BURK
MFEQPRTGQFTQGTIFSCAYAENYLKNKVYGLVITARCDAAQEKVPVYSYVPVVSLATWMLRDGAIIMFERILADLDNTFSLILKAVDLSPSLLKVHPLDDIFKTHFLPMETDKAKKSHFLKFEKNLNTYKQVVLFKEKIDDAEVIKDALKIFEKTVEGLLKELSGNRLSGYYLLRGVKSLDADDETDFIVLLREVHHIPGSIARKIIDGCAPSDILDMKRADLICPRFIDSDDFSLPIGKITSPWIEHIMQCFSMLFARIGVKDIDHKDVKKSLIKIGLGA